MYKELLFDNPRHNGNSEGFVSIKTDYHIHCEFDDGKTTCEEYVREAISRNMECIGFSPHWPISYKNNWTMKPQNIRNYLDTIEKLREKYPEIKILIGTEIDYLFSNENEKEIFKTFEPRLDYTIGAVHLYHDYERNEYIYFDGNIDKRLAAFEYFKGGKAFCCAYYKTVIDMLEKHKPDVIAHFDVVKKYNHFRNDIDENSDWYKSMVCDALDVVKQTGTILEINTGGIARGFVHQFYPSKWIMEQCMQRNIPITINSDAHCKKDLAAYFDDVEKQLKEIGYKSYMKFTNHGWEESPI